MKRNAVRCSDGSDPVRWLAARVETNQAELSSTEQYFKRNFNLSIESVRTLTGLQPIAEVKTHG